MGWPGWMVKIGREDHANKLSISTRKQFCARRQYRAPLWALGADIYFIDFKVLASQPSYSADQHISALT